MGSYVDELALIEELVNTRSVELATDALPDPDALAAWLTDRDLVPDDTAVRDVDLVRVLAVREGLRALIARNNAGDAPGVDDVVDGIAPDALERLAEVAPALALVLDVDADPPRLAPPPGAGPIDRLLAGLLAAVAAAVADGRWRRLKACRQPGCRWAYYDHSRNTSRAWCDMATCGNRAKARAFRERQG